MLLWVAVVVVLCFCVCVHVWTPVPQHIYRGQNNLPESWFSSVLVWAPGTELRSPSLHSFCHHPLSHLASSQTLFWKILLVCTGCQNMLPQTRLLNSLIFLHMHVRVCSTCYGQKCHNQKQWGEDGVFSLDFQIIILEISGQEYK